MTCTYHLDGAGLHSLLEDAAIRAKNGDTAEDAAAGVLIDVELQRTETGWEG